MNLSNGITAKCFPACNPYPSFYAKSIWLNPFLHTENLQQWTLKTYLLFLRKIPLHESTIIEKSWKVGDKRRNYLFWAISSFSAMFSKSHLLRKHQKASICGKGLRELICHQSNINFKSISIQTSISLANKRAKFPNTLENNLAKYILKMVKM